MWTYFRQHQKGKVCRTSNCKCRNRYGIYKLGLRISTIVIDSTIEPFSVCSGIFKTQNCSQETKATTSFKEDKSRFFSHFSLPTVVDILMENIQVKRKEVLKMTSENDSTYEPDPTQKFLIKNTDLNNNFWRKQVL